MPLSDYRIPPEPPAAYSESLALQVRVRNCPPWLTLVAQAGPPRRAWVSRHGITLTPPLEDHSLYYNPAHINPPATAFLVSLGPWYHQRGIRAS